MSLLLYFLLVFFELASPAQLAWSGVRDDIEYVCLRLEHETHADLQERALAVVTRYAPLDDDDAVAVRFRSAIVAELHYTPDGEPFERRIRNRETGRVERLPLVLGLRYDIVLGARHRRVVCDEHAHCDARVFDATHTLELFDDLDGLEDAGLLRHTVVDDEQQPQVASVSFLNLNLWNYNAPWPTRLSLIADFINHNDVSFMALQEVRYSTEHRPQRFQVSELVDALRTRHQLFYQHVHVVGAYYVEQMHATASGDAAYDAEGVAVLSRFPIINATSLRLSRDLAAREDDSHQRVVLAALVRIDARHSVWILTVHYALGAAARARATREILDFCAARLKGGDAILFAGDLNAPPSEPAIQALAQDGGFQDVWTLLRPGQLGRTFSTLHSEPRKRIDFVFFKARHDDDNGLVPVAIHLVPSDDARHSPSLDSKNSRKAVYSDHLGHLVKFQLK